jgi:hypothetical protein
MWQETTVGRRARMTMTAALAALATVLGGSAAAPEPARADVVWLCRPGLEPDPCRGSQATTVRRAGRPARVVTPRLPERPPVDCFYVYPTVSGQAGTNADKAKDPELAAIAGQQAARFSQACRVFAPVYRQLTLASILGGDVAARAAGAQLAYGDVREAWREYLRRDNHGRGVVLVGHSQGTFHLRRLIRDEIDRSPSGRRRLVSAVLLGGNVTVRRGRMAGGDFRNVPGCTSPRQLRCVIAYSVFGDTPPPDARFGRADTPGSEVLCTNPASLADNRRRTVTTLLRSEPFPGLLGAGLRLLYGGAPPTAPTAWLQPADRYSVRCARVGGAHVLLARPSGDARRLVASPDATWGLHLADVNLALGELVELVRGQGERYRRLRAARRR